MKVLFDTSVLVAALIVNHPKHSVCFSYDVRLITLNKNLSQVTVSPLSQVIPNYG
ncbi:hypothetical protein [Microseira sp. BLCC-F43]|jgi:predicted nucleic acid-binding protein|uniref:hypothetical protein n=1 Tax=Microseira sp. BLCC-F43 TaxID=3153602 RepID=UPI0035BA162E